MARGHWERLARWEKAHPCVSCVLAAHILLSLAWKQTAWNLPFAALFATRNTARIFAHACLMVLLSGVELSVGSLRFALWLAFAAILLGAARAACGLGSTGPALPLFFPPFSLFCLSTSPSCISAFSRSVSPIPRFTPPLLSSSLARTSPGPRLIALSASAQTSPGASPGTVRAVEIRTLIRVDAWAMGRAVFFVLLLDAAAGLPLESGNDRWVNLSMEQAVNVEQNLRFRAQCGMELDGRDRRSMPFFRDYTIQSQWS